MVLLGMLLGWHIHRNPHSGRCHYVHSNSHHGLGLGHQASWPPAATHVDPAVPQTPARWPLSGATGSLQATTTRRDLGTTLPAATLFRRPATARVGSYHMNTFDGMNIT